MVVALAVFILLIGGIFAISQGTVELSNDLAVAQDRTLLRGNFIEFMRRSFRNLPGGAEVRLSVRQRGSAYVPTINVINGGSSFTPGPALPPGTSMDVYADERPGGYLRVSLRVLDDRQTNAYRSGQPVRYSKNEPTVTLLDNVSRFEWRFYDAATNRWENNWKDAKRPILAEMNLQLDDGFQSRSIFWIPPVVPNGLGGATPPPAGGVLPPPLGGGPPPAGGNPPPPPSP
ncbi:MAG: hypothetical protein U0984_03880 [Prosthecobacter sp.]|nr:hypothetical protein [Prosthecobacter sp.]